MNIYIWEGALADWSGGLIVALAPNLRAAKQAARKAYGLESDLLEQDLKQKPQVVKITETTEPQAWTCSGGG